MSRMHNPPHPGEVLKYDVLPGLGLTVTEAARQLRVTRVTLSRIVNGNSNISPEMAIRLSTWLNTSPEVWLRMQTAYDLSRVAKKRRPRIARARKVA